MVILLVAATVLVIVVGVVLLVQPFSVVMEDACNGSLRIHDNTGVCESCRSYVRYANNWI